MIKHYNIDQNSEDWNELRCGKFTASTFSNLFMDAKTKGYKDAIIKVAYEKITGESEESYSNKWMQRGHEKEPLAVENYESFTFSELENAGFWEYDEFTGASPDRKIVGQNGGCEFKCPSFETYHEYLETGKIPKNYFWQIHGQLLCTGWDFIDYFPFSSNKLKQVLVRVERDQLILDQLIDKLITCTEEVKVLMNKIKGY